MLTCLLEASTGTNEIKEDKQAVFNQQGDKVKLLYPKLN